MAITRLGGANAITGTIPNSVLAAGNVIQVVNTEFTGTESTTVLASGGNFADSSLTATLTPSSTIEVLEIMQIKFI